MIAPGTPKPKSLVATAFAMGLLVVGSYGLQSASAQQVAGPEPLPNTAIPAGPEPLPYPSQPPNAYSATPTPIYPDAQRQADPRARSAAAWASLDRAKQMVQDGQAKEALVILKDFVIQKPKEPEGFFWAGVAFDHLGQPTRALRAYLNALTLSLDAGMDSAELRVNMGNALLKEGRVDEALTNLKRAVAIDGRLSVAHLSYARGLIEKGDATEALAQLRRAEDLNADSKQVAYYRLKALEKLGQKEEARIERKALIDGATDPAQKAKLQEEFKSLD